MLQLNRRQVLVAAAPLALTMVQAYGQTSSAAEDRFQAPQSFDFEWLKQTAKALAAKSYMPVEPRAADVISKIDFDLVQKIKFRADRALWNTGHFPVRLFHLDKFNPLPVHINVVAGGLARRLVYSSQDFEYGDTGLEKKLSTNLGFSGFRIMDGPQSMTDWLAFQGASYFRSSGQENQYGGSARGIAVGTASSTKEEFPQFVEFWLVEPDRNSSAITIYALLDGPSLTGAYRFVASKQSGAVIDIDLQIFFRANVTQLGIAPLTSMYWYGENQHQYAVDWRPEIHDSDGLAMWKGNGERIWRPLIDPSSLLTNAFIDENPKAFGLMQRDRHFDDYQDDGAFYNRRPSMWVEPRGDWGAGAVRLVEIPTEDEIHDNIVAFWTPNRPIKAGDQMDASYRLYWQNDEPDPPTNIARVVATRIGRGGVPGKPAPEDKESWKFVIDFAGGPLAKMPPRFDLTAAVTVSRGTIGKSYVIKIVGTDRWRAFFDVHAPGKERIDLRCYLSLDEKALTETWLYQYFPPV